MKNILKKIKNSEKGRIYTLLANQVMKLLPYEKFYFTTRFKPEEIQQKLERNIEPDKPFSIKDIFKRESVFYFTGFATNAYFEIKRIIFYQNAFLPRVKGLIEPDVNGSRVEIKMYMHILVMLFMCIWLGGVTVGCVTLTVTMVINRHFEAPMLIPYIMFLIGYGVMMWGFKYESVKAKEKLLELLEGEIEA